MRIARLLPLLVTGGCAQSQSAPVLPPLNYPQPAAATCPVIESSDWQAWINAMPGPGATPTLIVTGKAVVPSGGYRMSWNQPIVMESYPVQVSVELKPELGSGMASQATVKNEVRGEWPMRDAVGSVTITCGPKTLARISPVVSAR